MKNHKIKTCYFNILLLKMDVDSVDFLYIYTMIPNSYIGSGAQGWIECAMRDGVMYAVKFADYSSAKKEFFTTIKFKDHPHIIQAYSFYPNIERFSPFTKKEETVSAMVMEYANQGDLFKYVEKGIFGCKLSSDRNMYMTESYARILFHQLVEAVETCHTNQICHLDIKLENLLLKDWSIKLADFGLSRSCDGSGKIKQITGTTYSYSPPEFLNKSKGTYIVNQDESFTYDGTKVDIFNMGIVLFLLVTGFPPWANALDPNDWYYTRIVTRDFDTFWRQIETVVRISPYVKILLTGMLWPSPKKRYTIKQIKDSEWFRFINERDALDSLIRKFESKPVNLKSQFDAVASAASAASAVAGQGRKKPRQSKRRSRGRKRKSRRLGGKIRIPKLVRR